MKIILRICIIILLFCGLSCTSASGRFRSAQKEFVKSGKEKYTAELNMYTSGNGRAEMVSPFLPGMKISGEIKQNESGFSFYITGARFFSNWPNGWTDAEYQASGKLDFSENDGIWDCIVADRFELWNITCGQIRYHDDYYRDDDGLIRVKNRIDRIRETVRIVKAIGARRFYGSYNKKTDNQQSFRTDMARVLFPEKEGFEKLEKRNLLPSLFYENKGKFPVKRVLGTDYFWRNDYTLAVFPENIQKLRDSGTLWKDFDEAPQIFFSLYNLDYFFTALIDHNPFIKIK
ncbi:MAG: hypothetical protein JW874_11005 [Spirochaetales bacterium]|nr:hypothetical protein [Spirochaetales bacterium]